MVIHLIVALMLALGIGSGLNVPEFSPALVLAETSTAPKTPPEQEKKKSVIKFQHIPVCLTHYLQTSSAEQSKRAISSPKPSRTCWRACTATVAVISPWDTETYLIALWTIMPLAECTV